MEKGEDFIFGLRPVEEALRSDKTIDKILISRDLKGTSIQEIRQLCKSKNVQLKSVPEEKLYRITRKNHQGIIAFLSPIEFDSIEEVLPQLFEQGKNPLLVILDGVTDVRNFGSIVRTAECMGAHAIIIPGRNSVAINADAVKTSAGAIFNIPICKEVHFGSILEFIQNSGCQLVACSEKATTLIQNVDFNKPTAIIMGDEGEGIHEKTLDRCDVHVGIEMAGKTSSLNVAIATGMILYEASKHRS